MSLYAMYSLCLCQRAPVTVRWWGWIERCFGPTVRRYVLRKTLWMNQYRLNGDRLDTHKRIQSAERCRELRLVVIRHYNYTLSGQRIHVIHDVSIETHSFRQSRSEFIGKVVGIERTTGSPNTTVYITNRYRLDRKSSDAALCRFFQYMLTSWWNVSIYS